MRAARTGGVSEKYAHQRTVFLAIRSNEHDFIFSPRRNIELKKRGIYRRSEEPGSSDLIPVAYECSVKDVGEKSRTDEIKGKFRDCCFQFLV